MHSNDIKDLISKRKQWVQSSKENNFDFDSILTGLYNNPSHFIYEILQNAEDAGATEIIFKLFEDRIEIYHNGKDFDFEDVEGITGIGISTKKEDINAIGKFGVGFKSVFAITNTPIIHSGFYHFKIDEFVIPLELEVEEVENTLIILPFNHPTRNREEAFEIIIKKLNNMELKTLLFLNNIKRIQWQTQNESGEYKRLTVNKRNHYGVRETTIISQSNNLKTEEQYLVFEKPVIIEAQNHKVEVAYRILSNKGKKRSIIKEKDTRLVSFFPTEKVTFLSFLIQGPFKTTPNRENIPLEDRQNRLLIKSTSELVAESIDTIKTLGLLNVTFLETLPIDQNYLTEIIYSEIYTKVKDKLLSNKALLPTNTDGFTSVRDALLARGKELPEILNSSDLKMLFNRREWLDTSITADKTRLLREYLINELKIREVDFENFASTINIDFIKRKTDAWFIDFYKNLLKQQSLWEKESYYNRKGGILRRKPIIRLSDRQHIEPCDKDGNIQVYLPGESKSKYKTVHESLIKDRDSFKFLEELGISKPDIFSEIKEFIIPKYSQPDIKADEEYYENIEKLLLAFNTNDPAKKEELLNLLKVLPIVFCRDSFSGEQFLVKPEEAYIPSEELLEYFKNYNCVYFISDEFDQKLPERKINLSEFFLAIGCENKPRKKMIVADLTNEEKVLLRKRNYESRISYEIHSHDYDIEGLDNFLLNITIEKSITFWDWLLICLNSFEYLDKKQFFNGEYKWNYYTPHSQKFEAKFLKTLKTSKWLFDDHYNYYFPQEISLSILSDKYNKNDRNIDYLVNVLEFQTDEIKRIEKKTGKKVVLMDEDQYQKFLDWEKGGIQNDVEQNNDKKAWIPESEPENTKVAIEVIEPEIIETKDLRRQRPDNETDNSYESEEDEQDITENELNKWHLKEIGNWGERYVYKHLVEEYRNAVNLKIIWLNLNGNVGKGYDFVISAEGKEIEYIEVKSKTDDTKKLIEITGTQWEFARKLYNEKEGDKYKIYIVNNAGTKNAKINIISNPVRLWKEGRLYAHPVNIKI